MRFLTRLRSNQKGAPAIEYALVACLVAIAAIAAMGGLGNQVNSTLGGVNSKVKGAG